jgi:hypothetical protein
MAGRSKRRMEARIVRRARWDRAFRVVGRYAGDAPDVAEHHDRYLEEACAAESGGPGRSEHRSEAQRGT